MKGIFSLFTAMMLAVTTATPALAASATKVYNSGVLVLIFLGFCALVVVAQLIPALITLMGMLKEAVSGAGKKKEAEIESGE